MMRARHLVKAAGSAIYLLDPQEGKLTPVASDLPWRDQDYPAIQGGLRLAQRVMEGGRPPSQQIDAISASLEGGQGGAPLSCACVPLRWGEEVVGVLSVFRAGNDEPFAAQQIYLPLILRNS